MPQIYKINFPSGRQKGKDINTHDVCDVYDICKMFNAYNMSDIYDTCDMR